MNYYIGVDIGGTKILSVLTNEHGDIIDQYKTESITDSAESLFDSVTLTIDNLLRSNHVQKKHIKAIGVGLPGLVDSRLGIAVYQSNIPWHNFPIADRLREKYHTNIAIDNDVAVAAYNEWHTYKSSQSFVYVTVSTGIAMTTLNSGEVVRGNGFAGELGQTFVYYDGTYERLETVISGPGLERRFQSVMDDPTLTTKDLFDQYDDNPDAKEIIDEAAALFSISLYQINAILDPDTIVFGGSVMTNNPKFLDMIKSHLTNMLLPDQRHVLEGMHISKSNNLQGAKGAVFLAMKA